MNKNPVNEVQKPPGMEKSNEEKQSKLQSLALKKLKKAKDQKRKKLLRNAEMAAARKINGPVMRDNATFKPTGLITSIAVENKEGVIDSQKPPGMEKPNEKKLPQELFVPGRSNKRAKKEAWQEKMSLKRLEKIAAKRKIGVASMDNATSELVGMITSSAQSFVTPEKATSTTTKGDAVQRSLEQPGEEQKPEPAASKQTKDMNQTPVNDSQKPGMEKPNEGKELKLQSVALKQLARAKERKRKRARQKAIKAAARQMNGVALQNNATSKPTGLITSAAQSSVTPEKATSATTKEMETTLSPGNQSQKKNKSPNKTPGNAANGTPVQQNGELSSEFKQKLLSSLEQFTRGTELEGILQPVKTDSPMNIEDEEPAVKSAKLM